MRNDHDPIRDEAMKTNQSCGRGYDFRLEEEYPPVPWGSIAVKVIIALCFLAGMCAVTAAGAM